MTRADVLVVVGAGVIGLSTGIVLAEAGARVRIVAAEPPLRSTSAAATGMCGPVFHGPDQRTAAWELATVAHLTALADTEPAAGVAITTGLIAAAAGIEQAPPLADASVLVRIADPDELPAGFGFGMWLRVPMVDMPVYLQYLLDRFAAAGGLIVERRVESLASAADGAATLVNCAGVGAAALCSDEGLHPVRGQHVVVENPGLEGFFMPGPGASEWASWHVHGDHVLLGGISVEDGWDPAPSQVIADGILERCVALEPRFADARIIGHRAGLRPVRPRARLEVEDIGGLRCVHNYGHGGVGVLQSWGCAQQAARLARG
ncbi:MAG: FAD-binding oxidoreductase [Pseudonocardia sp.]|nr:FAD-binding oxidoreductase [Pseudonocardia sp.]